MATSATDTTNHDELFKAFIYSGMHGQEWGKKVTHAVLNTPFNGEYKVFTKEKEESVHAEEKVLDHLRDLLTTTAPEDAVITLFLSYSPCNSCCYRIRCFLHEHKDKKLQLHVVFSAIYRIVRPSCNLKCSDQKHTINDGYKKANLKALKDLYQEMRDNLRPFNDQDWTDLQDVLNITDKEIKERKEEDKLLLQDFKDLMDSH